MTSPPHGTSGRGKVLSPARMAGTVHSGMAAGCGHPGPVLPGDFP